VLGANRMSVERHHHGSWCHGVPRQRDDCWTEALNIEANEWLAGCQG
jgi:hypothetical protein